MESSVELLVLQRLDESSSQLQNRGEYVEALQCMERGLILRHHIFGSESDEVWNACKAAAEICNLLAMRYLQHEELEIVLELLKKADILTERDFSGKAATFNNFACYYRRQGKLFAALKYLKKAILIEGRLINVRNPADTYINACAVLSQLGRHHTALEHAQQALIMLQEELLSPLQSGEARPAPQVDRLAVLAIAYHNIGVEQEFLKDFEHSIISYTKGIEVAERYLGVHHTINVTLKDSLAAAKEVVAAQAEKAKKMVDAKTVRAEKNSSISSISRMKGSTWHGVSSSTRGMKKLKEMARTTSTSTSAIKMEDCSTAISLDSIDDINIKAPPFHAPSPFPSPSPAQDVAS